MQFRAGDAAYLTTEQINSLDSSISTLQNLMVAAEPSADEITNKANSLNTLLTTLKAAAEDAKNNPPAPPETPEPPTA